MSKYPENLTQITTFILDIDGVLTDGTIIIEPTGEQTRTMNIKDGFALQLAVKRGEEHKARRGVKTKGMGV